MGAPITEARLRDFATCWNAGLNHVALAVRFKIGAGTFAMYKRRARAIGLTLAGRALPRKATP